MIEPMTDEYIEYILKLVHDSCKTKLIKYRYRGKPEPLDPMYCLKRCTDEHIELLDEVLVKNKEAALLEAADVALFAFYAAININE